MDSFLSEMITRVEERRLLVEHECSILSKLLKPWPLSKLHVQEEEIMSQESRVDKVSDKVQPVEGDMSQADILALEQVDQLLSKARWTRESKSKSKKNDTENDTASSHPYTATFVEKAADETPDIDKQQDSARCRNSTNVSGQEKILNKSKKIAGDTCAKKFSSVKKSMPFKPPSQATRKSSSRPTSSMSSKSISKKNQFVPAHVNAPFKTDVNTRVPNRKMNHLKKNQSSRKLMEHISVVPKLEQSQPLEATAFKALPGIRTESKTREVNNSALDADEPTGTVSEKDSFKSSEMRGQVPDFEEHSIEILGEKKHCQDEVDSKFSSAGKMMSLRDHNLDLKIPSKLGKLYSLNNTLLKQCHDLKISKKVSNKDPAEMFVEKLMSQTEVSEELWIRERALICLKAHNLMNHLLQSLQLNKITDKSSYEMMHRAKKKLELVLLMFGKLQDEADYFSQVQFKPISLPKVDKNGNDSPLSLLDSIEEEQPSFQVEEKILRREREYSQQWIRLRFMEAYCQIQLHLLSLAEEEWWHLVSSDFRDLSVLQLVHGLMTTNGEHLPAIVDNLNS